MARLRAGILALALGLIAWSAAAEPVTPGLKPSLAAAPLPSLKPDRAAERPESVEGERLLVRIGFEPQEMELDPAGEDALDRLAKRLKGEPGAPFAIFAYAGAGGAVRSARRISLGRALAVRSYLMERGVPSGRMVVRAFEAPAGNGPAERVDILWPPP